MNDAPGLPMANVPDKGRKPQAIVPFAVGNATSSRGAFRVPNRAAAAVTNSSLEKPARSAI